MESNLQEMMGEYEMIMEEKTKQNSVKFQGNMMMAVINGIEFLNNRFDPFDVKLDGWGEQLNENITDYDDIFSELYEKYKSKATLAPSFQSLTFRLFPPIGRINKDDDGGTTIGLLERLIGEIGLTTIASIPKSIAFRASSPI